MSKIPTEIETNGSSLANMPNADKLKLPLSWMALSLKYCGISIDDVKHWYWCVSPIYDDKGRVHLFCSRWRKSRKGMALWFTHSEIVHFVGDTPAGEFKYVETVLSNDNLANKTWQRSPHNPQIFKFGDTYALVYIVQDMRKTSHSMKIGLMYSNSLNGKWKFAGKDGIVLQESNNPEHWTYNSCIGVDNPTMAQIQGKFYIFFKAGKTQNKHMHYGYAVSDTLVGDYTMCREPKMDNIHYVEDANAFSVDDRNYLLTTDNYGENSGIFGAGILWELKDGCFRLKDAAIGYGVLSNYIELPRKTTYCEHDKSGKLERPGVLLKDGVPQYLYGCTRTSVTGSKKSQCYVLKIEKFE